ncbi:MAG: hypothetical protein RI885_1355 [Actinomycetota bacterium]|jgi:putative NADH-flavin reductase
MTTIAVFGGTGRTGRLVVDRALAAGHSVRMLARTPGAVTQSGPALTIVRGDILDAAAVSEVVAGSDAVISVFGQVKGSSPTVQTDGTRTIVSAMAEHGVNRIVSLSGGGLRYDEKDRPKVADRIIRLLLRMLAGRVLDDAKGHLEVLEASGRDWTVVRAPVLKDNPRIGSYRVGWVGVGTGTSIPRADLADFLLTQVDDRTFVRQLPFVSS